jgi:hypothetical protein
MLKTILGNFLKVAQNEGKFPVDAETLENFQSNSALTAALGAALGRTQVILSGCTITGNRRAEGYVYVKLSPEDTGEVLYFAGGNSNEPNCYVSEEKNDIIALGETYPEAYTTKTLSNGLPPHGEKKLLWSDFVTGSEIFAQKEHGHKISEVTDLQKSLNEKLPITTYNTEISKLQQKITNLEKAVTAPAVTFIKGMIMIWKGSIADIPRGWHLCDSTSGTIDLRDKFIVGAGNSYSVGSQGGNLNNTAKITLTYKDIPAHRHLFIGDTNINNANILSRAGSDEGSWSGSGGGKGYKWMTHGAVYKDSSSAYNNGEYNHNDDCTVNSQSMDNRPPYYALAYIQYIGV